MEKYQDSEQKMRYYSQIFLKKLANLDSILVCSYFRKKLLKTPFFQSGRNI